MHWVPGHRGSRKHQNVHIQVNILTTVNKGYMYVGDILHVNTNVFTCSA